MTYRKTPYSAVRKLPRHSVAFYGIVCPFGVVTSSPAPTPPPRHGQRDYRNVEKRHNNDNKLIWTTGNKDNNALHGQRERHGQENNCQHAHHGQGNAHGQPPATWKTEAINMDNNMDNNVDKNGQQYGQQHGNPWTAIWTTCGQDMKNVWTKNGKRMENFFCVGSPTAHPQTPLDLAPLG